MFKINIEFLKENDACIEGLKWFLKQKQPEMSIQDLKEAGCPRYYTGWVATYLCDAGLYWPNNRYNDAILKALLATGDVDHLYFAGKYWPNDRYHADILKALLANGKARYLYLAGKYWADDRYNEAILKALLAAGNAAYIYLAGKYWKDGRINPK